MFLFYLTLYDVLVLFDILWCFGIIWHDVLVLFEILWCFGFIWHFMMFWYCFREEDHDRSDDEEDRLVFNVDKHEEDLRRMQNTILEHEQGIYIYIYGIHSSARWPHHHKDNESGMCHQHLAHIWSHSDGGQMLVTHARWGYLAWKWMPYAFSHTTQPYNALNSIFHNMTGNFKIEASTKILLLIYFDYYIVETC